MPFFRRTILRDTVPDPIILRHLVSLNPDFLIFFYILFQISSFAHLKIEVKTLEGGMMVKGQRVDLPLTVFPGKRGRGPGIDQFWIKDPPSRLQTCGEW